MYVTLMDKKNNHKNDNVPHLDVKNLSSGFANNKGAFKPIVFSKVKS